jgi:hypothetical protein
MSAIQDIQRLISLSQPIPESVQRAALQEAALSGMSNAALASTLGVPEAMVSDAAAALLHLHLHQHLRLRLPCASAKPLSWHCTCTSKLRSAGKSTD